ncbi:MAG: hypothetical protein JXL84_14970 [Deltaproteobacteria bacterium]|nr:hypothetical protein [Deltaproteobacteria bacterium]
MTPEQSRAFDDYPYPGPPGSQIYYPKGHPSGLGGQQIYFPKAPQKKHVIFDFGIDLGDIFEAIQIKITCSEEFLTHYHRAEGFSAEQIIDFIKSYLRNPVIPRMLNLEEDLSLPEFERVLRGDSNRPLSSDQNSQESTEECPHDKGCCTDTRHGEE